MTRKWSTIGAQQRPRTSIIIRLSVTLVAWRGSSFGRDSQPMLISAHNLKKQKKKQDLVLARRVA